MVPPCSAACCATNANPSPEPPGAALLPREKRPSTVSCSSAGSPRPLSSTTIVTTPSWRCDDNTMRLASPWVTALRTRLSTASRSPLGQPSRVPRSSSSTTSICTWLAPRMFSRATRSSMSVRSITSRSSTWASCPDASWPSAVMMPSTRRCARDRSATTSSRSSSGRLWMRSVSRSARIAVSGVRSSWAALAAKSWAACSEFVVARCAAANRLSIALMASERSSASRTPCTAGMSSASLPSLLVFSVSLRSGRIAGPASSQPSPAAISTVITPTAM